MYFVTTFYLSSYTSPGIGDTLVILLIISEANPYVISVCPFLTTWVGNLKAQFTSPEHKINYNVTPYNMTEEAELIHFDNIW